MKNILSRKLSLYLSIAAFTVFVASSCAGTHDFVSNNFQQAKASHRVVAILPFDVRFDNIRTQNNPKNQKQQHYWTEQERQGSLDMQRDLFVYLAKQVQKGHYEVAFQDFTRTNKTLETNGIMLQDIAGRDKGDLAKILGVDAVIWGQTDVRITRPNRYNPYGAGRYNDGVETKASIYDANSGELMWSTDQVERPTTTFTTPHDLASRLMDNIARHLPYRLAKK